ncbi:hypothetical protein GOP47_0024799 [Adiantum capillus-veneris]|uniref:Uncharacterized protein n=1 Tax=Adiantum capillus-veneris TaxID=13818 RepID=A0A9D4U2G3_ADICA|nr:hypothetical protein GOP47_0024799 [Adiantum capillus-veneris]
MWDYEKLICKHELMKQQDPVNTSNSFVGTEEYIAPEVITMPGIRQYVVAILRAGHFRGYLLRYRAKDKAKGECPWENEGRQVRTGEAVALCGPVAHRPVNVELRTRRRLLTAEEEEEEHVAWCSNAASVAWWSCADQRGVVIDRLLVGGVLLPPVSVAKVAQTGARRSTTSLARGNRSKLHFFFLRYSRHGIWDTNKLMYVCADPVCYHQDIYSFIEIMEENLDEWYWAILVIMAANDV